jgi:hypothetical protein
MNVANDSDRPLANEPPVDFAVVLGEELGEIAELRKGRGWKHSPEFETPPSPPPPPHQHPSPCDREKHKAFEDEYSSKVSRAAHGAGLVGLAFSGGGIRSATFNLGVLQGFAKLGLLPMFDYLSTVSGGGYIGGWLEAWIFRAGKDPRVARCAPGSDVEKSPHPILRVQECLKPDRSEKPQHSESQALRFLREYSNYLTPRLGFLGADTWAAIAIYLRNLLLNQAVLVLFLLQVLLLPHLAVCVSRGKWPVCGVLARWCPPFASFILVLIAQIYVSKNMRHLLGAGATGEFPPSARQGRILGVVAAPLFASAFLLSLWLRNAESWNWRWWWWLVLGLVGFGLTWAVAAMLEPSDNSDDEGQWSPAYLYVGSVLFALISGSIASLLLWVFSDKILKRWSTVDGDLWHVVSFGPPLVMLIFLLVATLQLGLIGRLFPDPRREWWGRLGGWLLILSLTWAAIFSLSLYSPLLVAWASQRLTLAAMIAWIANTALGVLGGKSSKTGSSNNPNWKDKVLSLTPYGFIVGLGVALATTLEMILGKLNGADGLLEDLWARSPGAQKIAGWIVSIDWSAAEGALHEQGTLSPTAAAKADTVNYVWAHWQILGCASNWTLVIPFVVAAALCALLAWRVDLNEFSMNLFYRNRLVRCYLGASHKFRNPNPFTGFDPTDDFCLSEMRADKYSGPFPLFNTTLNLVKGQNLAWQERKGESFVITPIRAGFDTWLERLDLDDESEQLASRKSGIEKYGFRPTDNYAYSGEHGYPGGFRLGTAVSISGAAASPNMGYHSSPALAFLMTFFNVRLGFWAGNPRHNDTWTFPAPRFGLTRLLAELFGLTDDEAKYVYLSDGGHFENLGLYELVKRRCKFIVVCDADCDDKYAFGDLGKAIRKCREDIGVEIDLKTCNLTPRKGSSDSVDKTGQEASAQAGGQLPSKSDNECDTAGFSKWHWAIGTINYGLVDKAAEPGILVYVKTSLTGDEPADVLNYHRQYPTFPHQSTAQQWFTESQFESYRRLGEHVVDHLFEKMNVERILENGGAPSGAQRLFEHLQHKWRADSAAHPAKS